MIQMRLHLSHFPELLTAMQLRRAIVKFNPTYCYLAPEPFVKNLLAPKLWFREKVKTECVIVIVMKGASDLPSFPPRRYARQCWSLVFYELQMSFLAKIPMYSKGAVLVDFDCCGRYQHDFIE